MDRPLAARIPHELGLEEAKRRIRDGTDELSKIILGGKVSDERWSGDTFFFTMVIMGKEIPCEVDAHDDHVVANVDLPSALSPVSGMIRRTLETIGPKMLR